MKTKTPTFLLALVVLFIVSCTNEENPKVEKTQVSFTPCKQEVLKNGQTSDKVNVEFTDKGIQITYPNFEVSCDFTTVNVTHTLVNGVLNIMQRGTPSQANCVCYTDVSYTLDGIKQHEVNVIFIDGVQVYCCNENYPIEISFSEYSLKETSCKWKDFQSYNEDNTVIIINSKEELENYISCIDENYSKVDFSKHSLLLAYGMAPSSIVNAGCNSLQQISKQNYEMDVEIITGDAAVISDWQVPIVTGKLNEGCIIELIVTVKEENEITYGECVHENNYIDTIRMEGMGYLYTNSIPVELKKDNDTMYILYNKEDNSATFSVTHPTGAIYNGNICNFPDFAKEWEILSEGKQIFYAGELYVTGEYLSVPPYIGGDLLLTTLKLK